MKPARDIGPEIVAERDAGVRWKVLMQRYGLSRSRLYQLWRAARPVESTSPPLQQKDGRQLRVANRAE